MKLESFPGGYKEYAAACMLLAIRERGQLQAKDRYVLGFRFRRGKWSRAADGAAKRPPIGVVGAGPLAYARFCRYLRFD